MWKVRKESATIERLGNGDDRMHEDLISRHSLFHCPDPKTFFRFASPFADVRADVEKVSKSLTQIVGGVDVPSDVVEDLSFGAYFVIQCRISVGLFSTITLEAPPEAKDLGGLVGQVPKSAQALKVAYPNDAEARGEEDVGDGVAGGGKGYMYAVKRGKLGRVLPEYSLLCVGGELKEDIRQVEALLEGLNSMSR